MTRWVKLAALVLIVGGLLAYFHQYLHPWTPAAPYSPPIVSETGAGKIVLVPLDGRPPCRQFVIEAGKIRGYTVITPPSELQDYYSQPGDTKAMQSWLIEQGTDADAVIVSVDQLLYGGLLAAREKESTEGERTALLSTLRRFHAMHPNVPVYAFSILPRQTPQDTIDGYEEKRALLKYSRLMGRKGMGLPVDEAELASVESEISAESMQKYLHHFDENEALNRELIALAREGVLQMLVLGQDDGERYSIPNLEKKRLQEAIGSESTAKHPVILTHGADEIALTLLARIDSDRTGFRPAVYPVYNHPSTREAILPFMAVSTERTAQEKIALIGGKLASTPEDADLILYLSAGDNETDTVSRRSANVREIREAVNDGQNIALVDLSRRFVSQETLLPLLIENRIPLSALTAYAGWNTASNAVGTAVSQAELALGARRIARNNEEAAASAAANITFSENRYLEDYFYLKNTIDRVNTTLKKYGYRNTADLDLEHNARWANRMLQRDMTRQMRSFTATRAFREPFRFDAPEGPLALRVHHMTFDTSYPWPRTFEIYLQTQPFFERQP